MKLFHHITVFFVSEQEKAAFLEAGVEFTAVTRGPRGECAILEIREDDPRWERVATLMASLKGNDRVPKKYRVQDLCMTKPTLIESATKSLKRSQTGNLSWLDGYSGQSIEELLALEGKYRIDSLVLAFEAGIRQKLKCHERQALTDEERIVLAVEALEREVNNGGYDQFFTNSSQFVPTIVDSLQRIGCKRTAMITQRAIKVLGISDLTAEAIDTAIVSDDDDEQRLAKLNRCDEAYHKNAEPIAERLFAFIKANKAGISL
jgi:Domain of unknown function (DUF4375)